MSDGQTHAERMKGILRGNYEVGAGPQFNPGRMNNHATSMLEGFLETIRSKLDRHDLHEATRFELWALYLEVAKILGRVEVREGA